jgi:penicillin-binding protein 2
MIEPVPDRRPPITPQLALRVAVLGVVAFALFAVIFFRLWYLQVLSGDQYLAQAQNNRLRLVREQAPRGQIVDRDGRPLVQNRRATVVRLSPRSLPEEERIAAAEWGQAVTQRLKRRKGHRGAPIPIPPPATPQLAARFRSLGRVLGVGVGTIQRRVVTQLAQLPYAPVKVKTDVPASMRDFIMERKEAFPGVEVAQVYLRRYPEKELAAQLVGTVGEVSPAELKTERFRGLTQGTIVGKEGLERSYDRFLRGRDGATRYLVDALGNNKGQTTSREAIPGRQVRLSIDLPLQRVGQAALNRAGGGGKPGGFVAMDPRNGQVLAMGSAPSFDPAQLARPISQTRYDQLFGDAAGAPRFNRAISGLYPTGSTFKPITAIAALSKGIITPATPINDTGCMMIGTRRACNAREKSYGVLSLSRALQVSSDIFFYTLGRDADGQGEVIQKWARRLSLGRRTGIDLPSEFKGNVPDRAWRARIGRKEERYEKQTGKPCCTFSDKRPWSIGDNVNLAVGQGDLQATPLQMAVAYGAIANGGKVVRPHLGLQVEDEQGRLLQKIDRGTARRVKMAPEHRQAIMDGLHLAASAPGGTSTAVFEGWPHDRFPVFGKTGTAETSKGDQSWYVAYVPSPTKPIVVAVTIERGGFGSEAAAPATRQILSQWFFGRPGKFLGARVAD